MEINQTQLVVFFIILAIVIYFSSTDRKHVFKPPEIQKDTSGHVKPEHLLYDVLQKYSNGDKVTLEGNCNVELYTKYTIDVDMKSKVSALVTDIFKSVYGITHLLFTVQELNNIYEQTDSAGNKRWIIDATLHSVSNHYSVKVIVDIVILNGEMYVNYVNINTASNNNIINRYDTKYKDRAILNYHDNFTTNIRSLLDTHYKQHYKVIGVTDTKLDYRNYDLEKVLSLNSLLKMYLPSNLSASSEQDFTRKGIDGYMEMYFPPDLTTIKSPQFCNKYLNGWEKDSVDLRGNQSCVFDHRTTTTEFNQPINTPGLFFDRSSYPVN